MARGALQPIDILLNAIPIDRFAGEREDHRLQADDVGQLLVVAAQEVETLANTGVIGRHPGVHQRKQSESGTPPLPPGDVGLEFPRAIDTLLVEQKELPPLDGGAHLIDETFLVLFRRFRGLHGPRAEKQGKRQWQRHAIANES